LLQTYIIISILFLAGYVFLINQYLFIWEKIPTWQIPENFQSKISISILIPARNEAENIEKCLSSIFNNNYPEGLLEVFVIDDFSSDKTASLVINFSKKNKLPNLKTLPLASFISEKDTQSYKKKAIEIGINQAKGELIITTDADCIVPENWLNYISSFYEKNNFQFIAAPVNFHNEKNRLERFQSLDFMGMMCVTGAGIHSNLQKMCNGANLAYTKKAFEVVGGFQGVDHLASGDDLFLMHKIEQYFPTGIGFLKNAKATILTEAKPDLTSFLSQRLRWATKNASYSDWKITAILAMVFFLCCNIFLSLFLIPFLGWTAFFLFGLQFLGKTTADYFFLNRMAIFFQKKDLMSSFFSAQLLHTLYIVFVGFLANMKKEYTWKGRKVK